MAGSGGGQDARQATAAAAAAAVVREAYASATLEVLEGESEEEKQAKLSAAKEEKMRKVLRWAAEKEPDRVKRRQTWGQH